MANTLNVYNEKGEIVKTVEAHPLDLTFGSIRALMEVLGVDEIGDTAELLRKVYSAWDQVTVVLSRVFPEMEYDDWEHVPLKELIPVLFNIIQFSVTEILLIPKDPN